jgi:hypothetical protein
LGWKRVTRRSTWGERGAAIIAAPDMIADWIYVLKSPLKIGARVMVAAKVI